MLYTLDPTYVIRAVVLPSAQDIVNMIWEAGNDQFNHVGFSAVGLPVIECDIKPADSEIMGIRWITNEIVA